MSRSQSKALEALVKDGAVTREAYDEARGISEREGSSLGHVLATRFQVRCCRDAAR